MSHLKYLLPHNKWQTAGKSSAVVFGQGNQDEAQQLAQHGADQVYLATNEELNAYSTDAFSQALTEVCTDG